jgi:putative serine protease PepD
MFKTFLISLVISIIVNLIWYSLARAEDFSTMRQSVVEVQTTEGLGSGVVLADGTVLTANHVIKGQKLINVLFFNIPFAVPASVLKFDADKDLAILSVKIPQVIVEASIDCNPVAYGQPLTMIGFPLGMPWVMTQGYVAGNYADDMHLLDMRTNHGNSGGPVFNDQGKVVGIALAEVGQVPDKERGIGNTFGVFLSTNKFCNWLGLS